MTDGGSKDDNASPVGIEGHNKLESFGFWRRKFCIKNVEILSVGKIAEFAKFAGGKRRMSPDRFSLIRATASYRWSSFLAFVERHEERVPLIIKCTEGRINESRFVMRAGPLWGESQVVDYFRRKSSVTT